MSSPIFLFSLPRSGSTLLQRILMSHSQIASVAEPWLMLPFSYASKSQGVLTEYSHEISRIALDDFISSLPNQEQDYFDALGDFVQGLYSKQCQNNELYFLDKTPRYYLIIPEILKTFPDAKFIFLFRNPVHVMGSMIETWGNGSFKKLYSSEMDLTFGPKALSQGYQLLGDKALAIQYEQFVSSPIEELKKICRYLGVDVEKPMLEAFSSAETKGRMGDSTGKQQYNSVSMAPLEKWKYTFATAFRKKIACKYLTGIDDSTLRLQGYEKKDLLNEIRNIKTRRFTFLGDVADILYSILFRYSKAHIFLGKKVSSWARKRYLS